MASMATKVTVLDAAAKATFATNQRRGSFEAPASFTRDGIAQHGNRRGSVTKVVPLSEEQQGGETGDGFKQVPDNFFKRLVTKGRRLSHGRAPSFVRKLSRSDRDTGGAGKEAPVVNFDDDENDGDGKSVLVTCMETVIVLVKKIPIRNMKIIRPDSKKKKFWVRLIMCATVYSVVLNPIQMAFNIQDTSIAILVVDFICDVLFISDLYIVLRTAVVLDNKFLKQPNQIAKYHLKSVNFYVDVVSSFPSGFVQLIERGNAWRSVRILKVLRLSKIGRILKEFSPDKFNTSDQQRLMILLFYLLIATHLLACGFIMINRLNDWPHHFFIPGVDPDDLYQTYTGSICWALMSLTGIGAILTPISIAENIFVLVTILVGVFVYAIILGNVYSTLANYQYLETAYLRKVSSVLEFCKYRNVPEETQRKVAMYYRLMWSRNKGIQDSLLLEDMTKPLRQEILMHSFKTLYNRCKWIKTASDHHKKILAENLRNEIYMPREVIINAGESPQHVFWVSRGSVQVLSSEDLDPNSEGSANGRKRDEVVGSLRDGCVYGILHIARNYLHNATLKTQTFVELAVMHSNAYLELRRVIPELQKMEDAHLEDELGDIIPAKKQQKNSSLSGVSKSFKLGRAYVLSHRRDSLANKLLGLIGNMHSPQRDREDNRKSSEREQMLLLDSKASAGTTEDLFKEEQGDNDGEGSGEGEGEGEGE